MSKSRRHLCMLAVLNLLVFGFACAEAPTTKAEGSGTDPNVAAVVDGRTITVAELDAKFMASNMTLAQQLYDARRQALDDIIIEMALEKEAASRNITTNQLFQEEVAKVVPDVSPADIEKFYNDNVGRMGGRTLEQMSGQIRQYLMNQNMKDARGIYLKQLKEKAEVTMALDPPRVDVVVAANDPRMGPPDAKITIVEFSDFQ